ncbi:flagellar hook-associated protein 2 [Paenibacillus sp. SAFN-117]|uniref:flagellar hook-associated protein 2 n=1 Tax=Paenibacillus sp. SAFN-117 TaxID=3436860 RepID=UPI003F8115AB
MRVGGLATGMDIDMMVKELMKAERMPYEKLNQKKQTLDWQRSAYREINSKLLEFRNLAFDMTLNKTFNVPKLQSSDESVVSVTGKSVDNGSYSIFIEQLATSASLTSKQLKKQDAQDGKVDYSTTLKDLGFNGEGSFKINDVEIKVNDTDNIANLLDKVNSQAGKTGVKLNYDATLERLFFTSSKTGSDSKIELTSDSDVLQRLQLSDGNSAEATGKNAIVKYNGSDDTFEFSTNVFTINGMTFTAKKAQSSGEQPINISVTHNTDAVVDKIKTFVEKYNELVDLVHGKLTEKKYRDYHPLSDEEKEAMKEKDIERWEEKAKSGLLQSDPLLRTVMSEMRLALAEPFKGKQGELSILKEIGITTGDYRENGKLHLDEEKLRQAIVERPEEVTRLFTSDDGTKSTVGDGFATRLNNVLKASLEHLTKKAGTADNLTDNSFLSKDIRNIEDKLKEMSKRLLSVEERYYRQFTAMEKAINQMNSQSAWLAQQFGG